ncbi:MAG: D-2-hydroxyacid dehydrogenase, partial [Alphaproteobacteria bacterium]|nr:D-2-hydroxyacid dehydrogenase [Alphaproteobacteria bacterium]
SSDDPANYIPRSLDIFFANLRAFAAGRKPPNQVDLARGY